VNNYPLTVGNIVAWLRSKEEALPPLGIALADLHEHHMHLPYVGADFDSSVAMGRISFWVSGDVDLQVLRVSDGRDLLFRHEHVLNLESPELEDAYQAFLQKMIDTQESSAKTGL
jgi:hypothetical protein